MANYPRIAVIGGGTGSFTLLRKLKLATSNISAIVNMSDDGGSTGILRDELGVLPPGDIRQCLAALSNLPEVRELFSYRFGEGILAGHSLGNVIISGLELKYEGDFVHAIEVAGRMLNITGRVIPVTLQKHKLTLKDGETLITGQYLIETTAKIQGRSVVIGHDPKACINPEAAKAIKEADLVVIAPGNLFTSLLPALSVDGMKEALGEAKKLVMVANLVNKPGQTDGWHVADYVKEVEKYIGEGQVDYVLYNNDPPDPGLLDKYAREKEFPVGADQQRFNDVKAKAIGGSYVSKEKVKKDENDTLMPRSFIRHNASAVSRQLMELV
jgi:uncharacterized cofD-like protein